MEEAVCFGWIDGLKRRVDDEAYTLRFTPRKPDSKWSESNVKRYRRLEAKGRMAQPGRAAWKRFQGSEADIDRPADRKSAELGPELLARLQADADAWNFHHAQPPGYRKTCAFWVMSAKRKSTRERRLDRLIRFAAAGERVPEVEGKPAREDP